MTAHKQYRNLYRISTTLAFIITDIIILHDITPFAVHLRKIYNHLSHQLKL